MSVLKDEINGSSQAADVIAPGSPVPHAIPNGANGAPSENILVPPPGRKLTFEEAHAQTMREYDDALRRLAE